MLSISDVELRCSRQARTSNDPPSTYSIDSIYRFRLDDHLVATQSVKMELLLVSKEVSGMSSR